MKRGLGIALTAAMLVVGVGMAGGAEIKSLGQKEYEANCAVCHGERGSGNGGLSQQMNYKAPPINRIQAKNGGVFPVEQVYRKIDGRAEIAAHSPSVMLVWATKYINDLQSKTEAFLGMGYQDEPVVRARILALIDYIAQFQEK